MGSCAAYRSSSLVSAAVQHGLQRCRHHQGLDCLTGAISYRYRRRLPAHVNDASPSSTLVEAEVEHGRAFFFLNRLQVAFQVPSCPHGHIFNTRFSTINRKSLRVPTCLVKAFNRMRIRPTCQIL